MKLIAIAAIGKNRELGLHNDLPWKNSLKKDLAFFKAQTIGQAVLMGRNTLESIQHLLPGRTNLILSSSLKEAEFKEKYGTDIPFKLYRSLGEFFEQEQSERVYVIGGASLYKKLLNRFDEMILTEIGSEFEADVYFPWFDASRYEKTVLGQGREKDLVYRHVYYAKKPME